LAPTTWSTEQRYPTEARRGRSTVLARVVLLLLAVACVLVGIRFAPNSEIGVIGHPTAALENDTGAPVVVLRCVHSCAHPDSPVDLPSGHSLRLEPGSAAEWLVEDRFGDRLGCFTVGNKTGDAPEKLYVSGAGSCRT
jgi:hypothetical protein